MKNIISMTCIVEAACDMMGVSFGEYYSTENVMYKIMDVYDQWYAQKVKT